MGRGRIRCRGDNPFGIGPADGLEAAAAVSNMYNLPLRSLTHSRVRLRAGIPSMPALAVKDHFTASVWASSASSCPGVGST